MTITVTNVGDRGPGSLRQAILDANDGDGAAAITFAPSLSGQTISLTSGELVITDDLTIDGDLNDDGIADITVDAGQISRVFNVGGDAAEIAVELSGLTVSGGSVAGDDGGGIFVFGDLTLIDSTVSGNSADRGGGIFNAAVSELTLIDSTVSGNSAVTGDGGGIYNSFGSSAILVNSTVRENSAAGNGGAISSGIYSFADITDSTISGNSAAGNGGGIYSGFAAAYLANSTVSNNSAAGDGGGVFNYFATVVTNSTISGNAADRGGGIYNTIAGGAGIYLTSTITAGNTARRGGEVFNRGLPFADANNLFGDSSQTNRDAFVGFFAFGASNIVATSDGTDPTAIDAILGPLADNGGPTLTQALVAGSPAIDAGSNPENLATDQRGEARAVGAATDIGAFEARSIVPTNSGTPFAFSQGTNGGFSRFGFDGDDFFISGREVSGRVTFQDFDDFLVVAAAVFDGTVEEVGSIDDGRLPAGEEFETLSANSQDEAVIRDREADDAYRIQFGGPDAAAAFVDFIERFLAEIDANDAVATDPVDFSFDAGGARLFFDDAGAQFGFTTDNGATQERFDTLATFVGGVADSLFGGTLLRAGDFDAAGIAEGRIPNQIRVAATDDVAIRGRSVATPFRFDFADAVTAGLFAETVVALFDNIDTANAIAGGDRL